MTPTFLILMTLGLLCLWYAFLNYKKGEYKEKQYEHLNPLVLRQITDVYYGRAFLGFLLGGMIISATIVIKIAGSIYAWIY